MGSMIRWLRTHRRRWSLRRGHRYRGRMQSRPGDQPELRRAFLECPGQWIAVERQTGRVLAAKPSPYELAAYLKAERITGVDVLRAPSEDEPELVGLG